MSHPIHNPTQLLPKSPHFDFSAVEKPNQLISYSFPHPTSTPHPSSSSASTLILTHSPYPLFALEVLSIFFILPSFFLFHLISLIETIYKSYYQELRTGRILIFRAGVNLHSLHHFCSHCNGCFGYLKLNLQTCCPIKMLM